MKKKLKKKQKKTRPDIRMSGLGLGGDVILGEDVISG